MSMGRVCYGLSVRGPTLLWAKFAMGLVCYGPRCPVTMIIISEFLIELVSSRHTNMGCQISSRIHTCSDSVAGQHLVPHLGLWSDVSIIFWRVDVYADLDTAAVNNSQVQETCKMTDYLSKDRLFCPSTDLPIC